VEREGERERERERDLRLWPTSPKPNSQNSYPSSLSAPITAAMSLDSHIEKVLWTKFQISKRVTELASQITSDFSSVSPPPLVVGVATGAFLFLADLVRQIQLPISVDFIRAESYGSGTESSGAPRISLDLKLDVKEKHVILVPLLLRLVQLTIPHVSRFFFF
jgi:hypothetical protein